MGGRIAADASDELQRLLDRDRVPGIDAAQRLALGCIVSRDRQLVVEAQLVSIEAAQHLDRERQLVDACRAEDVVGLVVVALATGLCLDEHAVAAALVLEQPIEIGRE